MSKLQRRTEDAPFPNITLLEAIPHWAKEKENEVFCRFLDNRGQEVDSYTFGQLESQTRRVSALLDHKGIERGDKILLAYPPGLDFIVAFFACLRSGIVAVPVYPPRPGVQSDVDRLSHIQQDCGAKHVLSSRAYMLYRNVEVAKAKAKSLFTSTKKVSWPKHLKWIVSDGNTPKGRSYKFPIVSGDDPAFLQYTSGSTASPKGVVVSHDSLSHNSHLCYLATGAHRALTECSYQVRMLTWLPQYRDMGLIGGIVAPLHHGVGAVLMSPVTFIKSPPLWLEVATKYKASILAAPSFAYLLCARKLVGYKYKLVKKLDLSSVRHCLNGAEPIQAAAMDAFYQAYVPHGLSPDVIIPAYGLAEHTAMVTSGGGTRLYVDRHAIEHDKVVQEPLSSSQTLQLVGSGFTDYVRAGNVSVVIVDPETCALVGEDKVGEIWTTSLSKSNSYFGKPEVSSNVLHAKLSPKQKGGEKVDDALQRKDWLRTGDLGFLHHQELFVCGRIKDLIIIRGRNVFPQDLEVTMESSNKLIRPGCVAAFSFTTPGSSGMEEQVQGFAVVAEIRDGHKMKHVELSLIAEQIRSSIVAQHSVAPCSITLIRDHTIPKTTSGKISRHRVKQALLDNTLSVIFTLHQDASDETQLQQQQESSGDTPFQEEQSSLLLLQQIVADALGMSMKMVPMDTPLYNLGVDSMAMISIQSDISETFQVELDDEYFENQDIDLRLLDQMVKDKLNADTESVSQSTMDDNSYPLTPQQIRMLVLESQSKHSCGLYNIPLKIKLAKDVDVGNIRTALSELLHRHLVLCTRYQTNPIGETGYIESKWADRIVVNVIDSQQKYLTITEERALYTQPFDLSCEPSLRAHFHSPSSSLYLVLHHIAVDGGCLKVLLRDLELIGAGEYLPPVLKPYHTLSATSSSVNATDSEMEFWIDHLGDDTPPLDLPQDESISNVMTGDSPDSGTTFRSTVTQEVVEGVRTLAKSINTTPFVVYLCTYEILLQRFTRQTDVVIGLPTSGRGPSTASIVGLFVNTIALRLSCCNPNNTSLKDHFISRSNFWQDIQPHLQVPFDSVVLAIRKKRGVDSPLFNVWFNYLSGVGNAQQSLDSSWIKSVDASLDHGLAKFPLALDINGEELILTVRNDVWGGELSQRFLDCYVCLLRHIGSGDISHFNLATVPLVPKPQEQHILSLLSGPIVDWTEWPLMHQFFEKNAEHVPDSIALRMLDSKMTYGELEKQANQLAHVLISKYSVGLEDCVGILLPRSFEMIICMIAILKTGAAYVPMDDTSSNATLNDIVNNTNMKVCLSTSSMGFSKRLECCVALETLTNETQLAPTTRPTCPAHLSSLAYVLFTSGSTGTPKGVEVRHRGVSNFGCYMNRDYPRLPDNQDNVLLIPRISWDGSVNTIVFTFARGSTLCIVPHDKAENLAQHIDYLIREMNITRYIAPPGLLEVLDPTLPHVNFGHIISGGDVLTPKLLEKWEQSGCIVHNVYGPTETTVYVTHTIGVERECKLPTCVSIGRPLPNTRLYVLDDQLQVVPIGVTGEICIGGITLARGYRGLPDLTAQVFVPNPFVPGEFLYRTGDLGKCLQDGQLVFKGRLGGYVKLRGFRVELGAIETTLEKHPMVDRSITLVDEVHQVLVAFVAVGGHTSDAEVATADRVENLKQWCKMNLVDYMIPAKIIVVDELPLDPKNGKVDIKDLWRIAGDRDLVNKMSLPKPDSATISATEQQVMDVWVDILELSEGSLSTHDNFFTVGGQSITAARISTELAMRYPFLDVDNLVFRFPTISSLSEEIDRLSEDHGFAREDENENQKLLCLTTAQLEEGYYPITSVQQRMLLLQEINPDQGMYNVPVCLILEPDVDIGYLTYSVQALLKLHPVLLTRYGVNTDVFGKDTACGKVEWPWADEFRVQIESSSGTLEELKLKPFNLHSEPSLRVHFFPETSELLINVHHIAIDGKSLPLLLRELSRLYHMVCEKQGALKTELPTETFLDYAYTEHMCLKNTLVSRLESVSFWVNHIGSELPNLKLPRDYSESYLEQHNIDPFQGSSLSKSMSPVVTQYINHVAKKLLVSPFSVYLAAMQILLGRFTGQESVMIGVPVVCHSRRNTDSMVGMFVNTLAIKSCCDTRSTFENVVQQVSSFWNTSRDHHDAPLDEVARRIQNKGSAPIFQACFNYLDGLRVSSDANEISSSRLVKDISSDDSNGPNGTAKFDISVTVDHKLSTICVEYRKCLWNQDSAKTFLDCFEQFLIHVQDSAYNTSPIRHIPLLTKEQNNELEVLLSGKQVEYDRIPLMHQFFEDAVDRHPEFVALKVKDIEMTYQQVEDRANRLARYLVNELGVQVEDCVGVLFPRGCEMIIALLAILKAGGAYVPLDENYPKSRIDQIVLDSEMKICLTTRFGMDGVLLSTVEGCGVALEDIEQSVVKQSSTRLDSVKVSPSNLAYVLYTSGSTGKPKGVEIEHGNVANLGQHYASRVSRSRILELESQERELLVARLSWDVSVGSMIRAFLHNRILCLLSASTNVSSELESVVVAQRITHILCAPSVLTLLNPVSVPSLREIECIGDKMLPSALKRWECTGVVIANTYGPTETTVISHDTFGIEHYSEHGVNTVPFGYAFNNNCMRVLDEYGMAQPQGVVGELYINGPQVARGYRNMPELTSTTFVSLEDDPFQRRWYRTGDLVRVLCDGQLEFMGRIANGYVKLRGYRIELGEIESVIEMHPNVAKAAVIVDEERQLMIAFVALNQTVELDDDTLLESLRKQCVSKLADYMIPHSFNILDEMPLDVNGKLNKKSLSTLINESYKNIFNVDSELTDLTTHMENTVAQVWSETLHIDVKDLFKESKFFQIGGHSIAAARATSQLSNVIGTTVQLVLLWRHSSLGEYAETVVQLAKDPNEKVTWYPLPEQLKSHGIYPLSHVQQRMLLLQDLEPDMGTYNVPVALRLSSTVDIDRLEDAFRMLLRRHSVLVTKYDVPEQFKMDNNVQFKSMCGQIQKNWIDTFKLDVVNNETDEELELLKLKPFNLREEPSIRAHFFTQSNILLVNIHHIAVDGSCLAVVIRDLVELYETPSIMEKQTWSYIDYAHTEYETEQLLLLKDEESNVSSSLKYWLDHLGSDLPVLKLPRDYSDTWIEEHNIQQSQGGSVSATIDEDLQSGVNKLSSKLSVSPFVIFLTAMEVVLHRFTAQDDVIIGVPVANRERVEVSEMVGMFVNTVAIRCQSELTETFEELVKKREEMWIESMEHHHVPFDTVVSALSSRNTGVARSSSSPVFQVMFNYLTGIHNSSDVDRVTEQGLVEEVVSNEVEGIDGTAKVDITLSVDAEKGTVQLGYRSRLWMRDTGKRFLDAFFELLRFVTTIEPTATECALVLRNVPIVGKQEQQRIERLISGQQVEYDRIPLMHQFFEDAVDRHPDFVALKMNDIEMTYQQVEDHANRLARYLVNELGVQVEDCVGVLFPRGCEMIIALLAILKAGGAYVPLDENYPKSRIDQIVSDSEMQICLTTRLGMDGVLLSNVEGCGIALEDIEESVFKQSCARLDTVKVSTSNLAYVLYTSGSTGKPKGVEMEHQSMGNFGLHLLYSYHILKNTPKSISTTQSGNRILLTSRLSWDVSICTMLKAFTQDCVVCILHPKHGNDIATAIADEVAKSQITILDGAPSLLSVLNPSKTPTLRDVFCIGDTLTQKLECTWVTNGKRVTNYYGPTETNAMMGNFSVENSAELGVHSIPIGTPYRNVVLRVLDQHGMTQPQGVVGELYIGGAQLARGYRNMPELTAKTFVKLKDDPLQRRWYKTGDLVRVLCDGQLEFMGRIANGYVKLRGYRIELGEIESVIEIHPNVARAAVIVDEERQSLIAFVVLNSVVQDDGAMIVSLRKQCVSKLTDYMIPHSFKILDKMPLDANGKLYKKALPALNFSVNQATTETQERDMPSSDVELKVADIWSEVLGVPKGTLSLDDDFFAVGGHSLLVSRAVSIMRDKIDALGDISTRDMYTAPTIRACCEALVHCDSRHRTSTLVSESRRRTSTIALEEQVEVELVSGSKISDQTGLLKTARSTGTMSNLVFTFSLWLLVLLLIGLCLYPSVWIVLQVPLSSGLGLMFVILPYLVGASISFVTLLTLLTLIVKWGLIGKLQPGRIQTYSRRYAAWWLFDRLWMLYQTLVATMFHGTIYLPRILGWFGARIGTGVFLENLTVRCPDMIEIGDGSMIESDVTLHVVEFEQGTEDVILGSTKIGAHCVLGAGSFVEFNSVVGSRCMVAPLCHVPQNSVLESDCRVTGTLAAKETLKTELPELDWGIIDLEGGRVENYPVWDHAASTSYWLHSAAPFVVQLPGFVVMLGYYLVIGLFASTLNTSRTIPVLIAIVSKPLLDFVLMIVVSVLVRIIRELLLLGEHGKPGTCAVFSTSFYRRWIASQLYRKTAARYNGTMLSRMCTKIQGGDAELSSEFSLEPMEPKLTKCGTGFFAANGTQLRNVSFRREGLVEFGRIDIGNNCMVLDRSVVLPGSVLEDHVTVGALSVVDGELKSGSLLFGNPAIIREVRGIKRPTPKTSALIAALSLVLNTYAIWLFNVLPITGVFVGLLSAVRIGSTSLTSSENEIMGFVVYIAAFPMFLVFWSVFLICVSLCCKWLLVGKFEASIESSKSKRGAHGAEFGSLGLLRWLFCNGFIHGTGKLVISAIDNPNLTRWYLRAMGAEIANDALVDSDAFFFEADMLTIESGAKLGSMATVFCHSFENGVLEFKPVHIGRNADVGARSVVLPGSVVSDSVMLLPLTHVMPEECFRAGCTYGGSPAERVEV